MSLDSDSDSDIQQKIEDYITSSIDHLNSLQEKIRKNAFSEDQLSEAYEICRNYFNSLDAFFQNQPNPNKKQKKSENQNNAKKSESQKKRSFKDDEDEALKSDSNDSNKSNHNQNKKDSVPSKKKSSTTKDKKKTRTKMSKYFDDQDLFLQENNK